MMRFTFPGKSKSCMFISINSDEKEGKIWINREMNEIALCNPVHRIYQGWGLPAGFSGWMPIFPVWSNYTAAMIGDHVSTMISDAYIKGIKDFDVDIAYFYMRRYTVPVYMVCSPEYTGTHTDYGRREIFYR
jgi:hypothetical protein